MRALFSWPRAITFEEPLVFGLLIGGGTVRLDLLLVAIIISNFYTTSGV